jgi:hypothetical protein
MNMQKDQAVSSAAEPFAREVFTCQSTENEMIEIVISIAALPLVSPPRPKRFALEVTTPAGASFEVRGMPGFEATIPLVNPPNDN